MTLQAYYAARAPEYDNVYRKPERQADLRAIETWLTDELAGRHVLELACGTGYWTPWLARKAASVTATDVTPETLALARMRPGTASVRFELADAYAPPRLTPRPDGAFAGFWLSHVPYADLRKLFAGWHAVLAPGARVVCLDNRFVAGSSTPIAETDADGNTWQLRPLADGSRHRVLKNFPSKDVLCQALDGIGADVRFIEWPHYWALTWVTA